MFKIEGTYITLTRGDTLECKVNIYDADGNEYTPSGNDVVRFALKKTAYDRQPAIYKVIPNDTMVLTIEPEDTQDLDFGTYVYDIQITLADGTVDTFIADARFNIGVEVE